MAELRTLPLSQVDEPEIALRAEMDDEALDELTRSIRDVGLLYPIIVHRKGDRYEVRDGHRRFLALRRLQKLEAQFIVHSDQDPPPEAVKLLSNLLREDNTHAEIALWLAEVQQRDNLSLEMLCTMVQRSEEWVNQHFDLLRGGQDVFRALGNRAINFSQARALNRCKDAKLRGEGLKFAIMDHVPARKLEEWLKRSAAIALPANSDLQVAEPGEAQLVGEAHGIECFACGGFKDPQNMVNVWVHRWEFEELLRALRGRAGDVN